MNINNLDKIHSFLHEHHVLSLATCLKDDLSVCSLFYVYCPQKKTFIVASSDSTTHIKHIQENNKIAGNILLETKSVAKIQGIQFRGSISICEDSTKEELYFKVFAHARIMKPQLWQIEVDYFKMTDNTLGFGKKLIWKNSSLET